MKHGKKPKLASEVAKEMGIQRKQIVTPRNNVIQVFYNPTNDLLVVDLCNDLGGNEVLRMQLNEEALLEHLK